MTQLCSSVLKVLREWDNRTATEQPLKIKSGKQKVNQASEKRKKVIAREVNSKRLKLRLRRLIIFALAWSEAKQTLHGGKDLQWLEKHHQH